MARVTGDGHMSASQASDLLTIWQRGHDTMSVQISYKAGVLQANLANGHDTLPLHADQWFWHSRI